jgi:type IV fimbrial biogenesis protein FimT
MGSETEACPAHKNNVRGPHDSAGFTLFELLIVLAIAAILLGLGAPSFSDFRRNARLTSAANDLLAAAQLARTEAIKRQVPVSICPAAGVGADAVCGTTRYERGWITFVDQNGDCMREEGDDLLRVDNALDRTMNGPSNGSCISFGANGFARPAGAPSSSQILFCDRVWKDRVQPGTDLSAARGMLITKTGRVEIVRQLNRLNTWDIVCDE